MSNSPDWFLQAVQFGTVDGKKIPEWFPTEDNTPNAEPDARMTISGPWPLIGVGSGYKKSQVKPYSHYFTPIQERQWKGRSRIWGDADASVQDYGRILLIEQARAKGLNNEDTAYILATAHVESGFNPDAASNESATGLGQFIDATGAAYGIKASNRWDIKEQARALVEHYIDNKERATEAGQGIEYIYAYHHDGPSLKFGGLGISRKKVMPLYEQYLESLNNK